MNMRDVLITQVTESEASVIEVSVTDFAMSVSKLINIVKDKKKRLVIVNRNERVAVIAPYLETKGVESDGE